MDNVLFHSLYIIFFSNASFGHGLDVFYPLSCYYFIFINPCVSFQYYSDSRPVDNLSYDLVILESALRIM